jgi:hypothetical protein
VSEPPTLCQPSNTHAHVSIGAVDGALGHPGAGAGH